MKNPRKSPAGNPVATLARTQQNDQSNHPERSFLTQFSSDLPQSSENPLSEDASFRAFMQDSLPRHHAPQPLRERIKASIKHPHN